MLFGKNKEKGIKFDGFKPVVIDLTDGKHTIDDVTKHDEFDSNPIRAFILAHMTDDPSMPTPIGVLRQQFKETYDGGVQKQIEYITEKKGKGNLEKILFSGNTWVVD